MNNLRMVAIRSLSIKYNVPYNFFELINTKEHVFSFTLTFRGDDGKKYYWSIPKQGEIKKWQ